MARPCIDITGQRFGRLVALSFVERRKRHAYWLCVCDCGQQITTFLGHLRRGNTQSCGCLKRERVSNAVTTHGLTLSPEWTSWNCMKQRCTNPNVKGFPNWGGRGITVCSEWLNSFETFLADMGPKPSPKHSIDRIDNDGNYAPGNCRWATWSEQACNRRKPNRSQVRG